MKLGALLALLLPAVTAAQSGDIEKYYPARMHLAHWYVVKDVQSGLPVGMTSFEMVAKETKPGGGTVYFVHNHEATNGIESLDYVEVTSEQVRLNRIVALRDNPIGATDVRFAPGLPMLRAPIEVGRTWSEAPGGDQSYTYRIDSKSSLRVFGKDIADCVRVVRTRGGTEDYRTDYCPGLGVAAFEMLTPAGKWLRGDINSTAIGTELTGIKEAGGACEYMFTPLTGPAKQKVQVMPPTRGSEVTFDRPPGNVLHLKIPPQAPKGQWVVFFVDEHRPTLQTFAVGDACNANFLIPPPPSGPSVSLVRETAELDRVVYSVMGFGWKANEALTLTRSGPAGEVETWPLGNANASGVSPVASVPFANNLPQGQYTLTIQGAQETATLQIGCNAPPSYCAVNFWRKL